MPGRTTAAIISAAVRTHRQRGEVRADQQDVVVAVRGRHHLRRGRAERAAPVDVLKAGGLLGGAVGAGPEAGGGAGRDDG